MRFSHRTRTSTLRTLAFALALTIPALMAAVGPKEAADHYRAERYREAVAEYGG